MNFLERVKNVFFPRIRNYAERGGFGGSGLYNQSGVQVSGESAMRCSAVLACIRILTEDVSTLPLSVKRKTADGWKDVPNHPVNQLLTRGPNPFYTAGELVQHMVMDCLLAGHFANYVVRDPSGKITAIYPLQAGLLTLVKPVTLSEADLRSGMTALTYLYGGPEYPQRQFSSADLWRGTLLPPSYLTSPNLGQFALQTLAREAIGMSLAMEGQAAALFRNGLQTKFAIVAQGDLDDDNRKDLRESFNPNAGFRNAWKPLVLENGVTVTDIGLTPQESQYIEARGFQLQDIARIFRVPPYMLGSMENLSTYGSQEQAAMQYVKSGILPWLTRIEQTAQRDLFTEGESNLFLKHDLTHLLKADQSTRYKCWQLGISSGFLSRNDARVFEGLDRQPGLDEFLIPAASAPANDPDAKQDAKPDAPFTPIDAPRPEGIVQRGSFMADETPPKKPVVLNQV